MTNLVTINKCLKFPKRQISDYSKLKKFAEDNFKFNENCIKSSKGVENTVEKGEIARLNCLFVLQTYKN